ncbi:MAG: sulfatase [Gemmatimonadota bacterium]
MLRILFGLAVAALGVALVRAGRPAAGETPPRRAGAVLDVVTLAVAAALATGWIEVAAIWYRQSVQHRFAFWSLSVPWMTPTVYLLLFAVPAAALVAVALVRSTWMPLTFPLFVFTLLAAGSVAFSFPRIDRYAMAILALGLAVQAARAGRARPARVRRWARGAAVTLACGTVVLAALDTFASGGRRLREAGALLAAETGRPNVLVLLLDTVRSESMSLYGYARPTTPYLEGLAEESTVFDWAISPSSWTLGTHASLFTGRWGHELSAGNRVPLDDAHPTLAEALARAGYATAHIVANARYAGEETGVARGAVHVDDYQGAEEPLLSHAWLGQTAGVQALADARSLPQLLSALASFSPFVPFQREIRRRDAGQINAAFLEWLDGVDGQPFYAFLNYFDAHRPYDPPADLRARFADGSVPDAVGRYDGTLASLDREIADLLATLESRGVLDETILIITSDHGEQIGDRGRDGHGDRLYSQLVRVPLLLRLPGAVPEGVRIEDAVTLRDLPATVLDLAGISDGSGFPGASWAGLWRGERAPDPWIVTEVFQGAEAPPAALAALGPHQSKALLDERYHYVWSLAYDSVAEGYVRPQEELFDYRADPHEWTDLATDPAHRATLERMRAEMVERFPAQDPSVVPR